MHAFLITRVQKISVNSPESCQTAAEFVRVRYTSIDKAVFNYQCFIADSGAL